MAPWFISSAATACRLVAEMVGGAAAGSGIRPSRAMNAVCSPAAAAPQHSASRVGNQTAEKCLCPRFGLSTTQVFSAARLFGVVRAQGRVAWRHARA